jgi:hypothetical protein
MRLYHFTCDHGAQQIAAAGELRANPHPLLPDAGPLIHLTDLPEADRVGLGLTSATLRCDRTQHRVTVDTDQAIHWPAFARILPRHIREMFEGHQGALPMHWYVARGPIPVATTQYGGAR